jgi:hypothetical protein
MRLIWEMILIADSSSASCLFAVVLSLIVVAAFAFSAEPSLLLAETFVQPLTADWHWGLGT